MRLRSLEFGLANARMAELFRKFRHPGRIIYILHPMKV